MRDKDGFSTRDHLEGLVNRDPPIKDRDKYVAELEGRDVPESVEYLRRWVYELHGRSGFNQAGLNPLSYGTIADWSRLKGMSPTPEEVDVLLMLDGILSHPPKEETESAD